MILNISNTTHLFSLWLGLFLGLYRHVLASLASLISNGSTISNSSTQVLSMILTLPLALFFFFLSFSQPVQARQMRGKIDLACKHISPIEHSYLSRHINYRETSKNLESRTITQFIKKLDGSKIYLLESDVKKIQKKMKGIFGKVRMRNCSPIKESHDLLMVRINERVRFATSYLGPKFKFNKNTQLILDPDYRKYSKTKRQADKYHKKYIQFQVSNYLATDMKPEEAKQNVVRSYERMLKRVGKMGKPENRSDLWAIYVDAFAMALDPHSRYLSQDALEDFQIQMRLSLEGIGATLSNRDGFTVVEQLVPGGAAARSGLLRPKDKIIAVGQEDGPLENIVEQELRDVVKKIRGPKGSKVRLKILRKKKSKGGGRKPLTVVLVRDKVKLEDEAASVHYIERPESGKKKLIALLNLPSFYADGRRHGRSSAKDLKKLLAEANKKKVDGVILDLSTNGGGALDDAVKIAGLFFKKGNVVKQSHRDPQQGEIVLPDNDSTVDYAGPLVVLTSRISASASEIVAGTLQDYKRALVVGGDHTFGKGSVQSVEPLPPGLGAIKTTVGMFFIPGGGSTQHRGVTSDISMPSEYSMNEVGEKTLDYSLPPKKVKQFLSKEAYVPKGKKGFWKKVTASLARKLGFKSKTRIAASEDFDKIRKSILKNKKRGKLLKVSEVLEDKKDSEEKLTKGTTSFQKGKSKITDNKPANGDDDKSSADKSLEETGILSPEEKKKRYLQRADIQEALHIMMDYIKESAKSVTLGAKAKR